MPKRIGRTRWFGIFTTCWKYMECRKEAFMRSLLEEVLKMASAVSEVAFTHLRDGFW